MSYSLNVVSFFSGCGGFDLGFKKAGYNVVLASDIWETAAKTYKENFPETEFLLKDIKNLKKSELLSYLNEKNVENVDVVIGGPPCQCFTRLNNNNLKRDDERNQLFREYIRMIKILKPKFVVMENVADLLSRKDEQGRYFKVLISMAFKRAGYKTSYKVFKTEKYGVPQKRRRVIFLATSKKDIELSFPNESRKTSIIKPFLRKLAKRKQLKNHEITINEPFTLKRIKHIPPGGYYEHLPTRLKAKKVRNGKLVVVKRYGSYLRRLHNNEPAITITNNYLIHPTKNRYITNREKAILHTFPTSFKFEGFLEDVSQQIANAVPPELARRIAVHMKENYFT